MNPVVGRLPFTRCTGAALSLFSTLLLPARLEAQCTPTAAPSQFEPNPPGPAAPRNVVFLSGVSFYHLSLYQAGAGGPWRMFMQETFGYSVLDLSTPTQPTVLKYDYLPSASNPVSRFGDGQSFTQTIAASSDGQRVALGMTSGGPANPPWNLVIGSPDGNNGFTMWGDTAPVGASGSEIVKSGSRYIHYGLAFDQLYVSDVTNLPTYWAPNNVAFERPGFPGGARLTAAGSTLAYTTGAGDVQVIDASSPGPVGSIAAGLPRATIQASSAMFTGHSLGAVKAAIDPANPNKLWILVELQPAAGENSPSYALFSVTENAGSFAAPVSSGPPFRVPSSAGDLWTSAGSSSSLAVHNGTVFVLMWAFRRSPTFQYVLYSTSTDAWGAQSPATITDPTFSLGEMKTLSAGSTLYGYMASKTTAWILPMSCSSPYAKSTALLAATNAVTGATINSGDAVVYGETITFAPQVLPVPTAGQRSDLTGFRWNFDFDFHTGALVEDAGAGISPRLKNPDNDQFLSPPYPPASATLVGPCDPRNLGVPAIGAGCWASVTSNTAQGGPDFTGSEAAGAIKPLVVGFEANNTNGSNGPRLFTANWKRPTIGLAATQILGGDTLVATYDGHPHSDGTHPWKWYLDGSFAAYCTTGSACTPTGPAVTPGTHTYWITVPYAQIGYSTPDYSGTAMGTYTATSFVPVFAVNGTSTGPVTVPSNGTITVVNSSKRASGTTGTYQYCLVPAGSTCSAGSYQAWSMVDPSSPSGSPASSATIPNPGGGNWLLKIRVSYTGGGTVDWPSANPATGIALTVTIKLNVTAIATPSPANSGDLVTFACSATGGSGSYSYSWDGQFGQVATTQNYTIRMTNGGSTPQGTTLTCTATDTLASAFGTADATATVLPVPPPTVTATATPNPANNGSNVTFNCSATGGTGTGYAYAWAGTTGGTFATTPSFSQTFSNSTGSNQTYPYTCSVTDSGGKTGTSTVGLVVLPYPLTVAASATPNPVSPGEPTQLICSAVGTGPFSYTWSLSDGTVGTGSPLVHTFVNAGSYTGTCTALDPGTGYTGQKSVAVNVALPPGAGGPYSLAVLNPCRILDTRNLAGPLGGPAIQPAGTPDRSFNVTASCAIPADAKSISVNVTATNVTATGAVSIYRGDGARTGTNTGSLVAGRTRANNAIVQLALDGSGTIKVQNTSAGAFDLILDVNGYFR